MRPPRLAERLLRLAYRREAGHTVAGDLEEEFQFVVSTRGRAAARHWYWRQVLLSVGFRLGTSLRRSGSPDGTSPNAERRASLGARALYELRADLAYGLRQWRRAPVFATVAVLLLAVAIGANTAVFSVLDAVLLRELPVARPHELRELAWTARRDGGWKMSYNGSMRPYGSGELRATSFSYPVYAHLRDRSTTFADLFLFTRGEFTLGVTGRPHRVSALLVSGNFFRGLGVTSPRGRLLGSDDDRAEAPPVVVLTSRLSRRLFGSDTAALGAPVTVNGVAVTIVGVTPPAFDGIEPGRPVDVFVPITPLLGAIDEGPDRFGASRWAFHVMGRVQPDETEARVLAESEALFHAVVPAGATYVPRLLVSPGGQGDDSLRRNYADPLWLLMAIMAAVLLIACANIAGLLLVRAASREREMAVRLALGAGRFRLLRQLLTESLLLALIAGLLGVVLARLVRGGLLPVLNQENQSIDLPIGFGPWVMAFWVGLCLLVGLLCGTLPALRGIRSGVSPALVRASRGGGGAGRLAAGKTLIAVQVALSLVLLVGAGLFARTLLNLRAQPLGFQPDRVLLFQLDATDAGYSGTRLHDFYERVLEGVIRTPGVEAASMSRYGLLSGGATRDGVMIATPTGRDEVGVHLHFVSPGHFGTLGIARRAGRDFTTLDRDEVPPVAIVNEALAARLAGGPTALGQRIEYGAPGAFLEVVGVVANARFASLREPAPPTLYLPYRQHSQHRMTFAVRAAGDPTALVPALRRVADAVDPAVPMHEVLTQDAQIDIAVRQERLFATVASGVAALAATLACLGIYGTLGYSVARRTSEIGLRMALGADPRAIVRLVLGESLVPVLLGVVAGLGAARLAEGLVEGMLFGLASSDAAARVAATLALVTSAAVAAWLPARRASAVNPMAALRRE